MKRGILGFIILSIVIGAAAFYSYPRPDTARLVKEPEPPVVLAAHKQNDPLDDAFSASGAVFLAENVNGWSQMDKALHDTDELTAMLRSAMDFFHLDAKNAVQYDTIQDVRQASVQGVDPEGRVLSFIVHNTREGNEYGTYLVIDATTTVRGSEGQKMTKSIRSFFEGYGKVPTITRCIQGSLNREMSSHEISKLQQAIFKKVQAKAMEGLVQDHFISISGYTPQIKEKVPSPKGDINLQAAIRYSSSEKKTLIWIGTPVITLEY